MRWHDPPRRWAALTAFWLLAALCPPLCAHNLPYSLTTVQVKSNGAFEIRLDCHLAALLAGLPQDHLTEAQKLGFSRLSDEDIAQRSFIMTGYLEQSIQLRAQGRKLAEPRLVFPSVGEVRADAAQTRESAAPSAPIIITGRLPRDAEEISIALPVELGTVLLRVVRADGSVEIRTILEGQSSGPIALGSDRHSHDSEVQVGISNYLQLGVIHILTGLDHFAFLIGLLMTVRSWPALLRTISIFTVAHSLTLCLSAIGWLNVPQLIVNFGIALSVLWLGVEVVVRRQQREPSWLPVFGFGLLHGMGLAEGLNSAGLSSSELAPTLLYFNLGVELGQVLVVTTIMALGWAWHQLEMKGAATMKRAAGFCVLFLGTWWTIITGFSLAGT